jgi:ATP-dependent RNA helicase DDX46/PRP5
LENGKQKIPPELIALAERFKEKVKRGEARFHGSGFKGKGFTFDENEKNEAQRTADLQKRQYEISEGIVVEDAAAEEEEEEDYEEEHYEEENEKEEIQTIHTNNKMEKPMEITLSSFASRSNADALSAVKKAQQIAQILDMQYKQNQANAGATEGHFIEELEINDYPQQARWRVTQKEASESVAELTGAAIIARGSYIPAGRKPNIGERKLYLVRVCFLLYCHIMKN